MAHARSTPLRLICVIATLMLIGSLGATTSHALAILARHQAQATLAIDLLTSGAIRVTERHACQLTRPSRHMMLTLRTPPRGTLSDIKIDVATQDDERASQTPYSSVVLFDRSDGQGRALFSYEVVATHGQTKTLRITGPFDTGRWIVRLSYRIEHAVLQVGHQAILLAPFFLAGGQRIDATTTTLTLPAVLPTQAHHTLIVIAPTEVSSRFDGQRTLSIVTTALGQRPEGALALAIPAGLFSTLTPSSDTRDAESQIAALQAQARYVRAMGHLTSSVSTLSPLLALASLVSWVLTFVLYERLGGNRHSRRLALWPMSAPPAILAKTLGPTRLGSLVLATLMRLSNRRVLRMEGFVFTWTVPDRLPYTHCEGFDVAVLHGIVGDIGDDERAVSAIQIDAYAQRHHASGMKPLIHALTSTLTRDADRLHLIDRKKTRRSRIMALVSGVSLLVSSAVLTHLTRSWSAATIALPGLLFLVTGCVAVRRTERGVLARAACRHYRAMIGDWPTLFSTVRDEYTDVETVILTLPRALALNRLDVFFQSLRAMNRLDFIRYAQALLKLYDHQTPPDHYDVEREYARCADDIDRLQETLETSQSIINGAFRS